MDAPSPALDVTLEGLEPAALWTHFDRLRRIPRPSNHEEGVRAFLREVSNTNGWRTSEDQAGNIVVYVPGRGRGTKSRPLAIQGHMDMVCEKSSEIEHDFYSDPVALRRRWLELDGRRREVLQAHGTTLGSDNGIGVVTALALGMVEGLDHPPLELVFTANEETGMTGAAGFDGSLLSAKRLLNLDAEEDGSIYLSCAGGRELRASWSVDRHTPGVDDVAFRLLVRGLHGGHSGVDIHLGRANALDVLIDVLGDARLERDQPRIGNLRGGGRPNAIPRDAEAILWCTRSRAEALQKAIDLIAHDMMAARKAIDPELEIVLEPAGDVAPSDHPLSHEGGRALVRALASVPDGVITWSPVLEGFVETSNNIGVMTSSQDAITMVMLTRSSKAGAMEDVQERAHRTIESSGAEVEYGGSYPGWEAKTDTALLRTAEATYRRLFGSPPAIKAIHAGLECGVLGRRLTGVDMISFGPDIRHAHTPDEALVLDTMPRFWQFVSALVADLCDEP